MTATTLTIADFLLARLNEEVEDADDERSLAVITPARHDRVLAECKAKRRIVEHLGPAIDEGDGYAVAADYALRALAAVYSDHEDYDESWAL